jgi:RNA polymerase sigma factor (sigma-70 family)
MSRDDLAQPAASPDAALVARYARGDQGAARLLTERHVPRLYALGWRMLGDAAEAEDVTQEAMLRLWRMAPAWEDRASVGTWLYRVASNLCLDRLRARRRMSGDEVPDVCDDAPGVVGQLEVADRAAALHAALAALPERQRLAIVLRHFDELSNPDIAEVLELSVEAVESLLSRGRRKLAGILADRREALGLGGG